MDAHLVSQEVASATAEANITPSTAVKASLSNEDLRTLTDMAGTTSAARATRTWNLEYFFHTHSAPTPTHSLTLTPTPTPNVAYRLAGGSAPGQTENK